MAATTASHLARLGFRVVAMLAGHGPWQQILDEAMPEVAREYSQTLFLWGVENTIGAPEVSVPVDHAARVETATGLALFPELIRMKALDSSHEVAKSWPGGVEVPPEKRHPDVEHDARNPRFSQMGEDARLARAEEAEPLIEQLVSHLAARIQTHLQAA
jgi:creatinine amidohydrolase/Fe(II)-dependent formamide hydrolase-like protein